jgi:hypothetical protein
MRSVIQFYLLFHQPHGYETTYKILYSQNMRHRSQHDPTIPRVCFENHTKHPTKTAAVTGEMNYLLKSVISLV